MGMARRAGALAALALALLVLVAAAGGARASACEACLPQDVIVECGGDATPAATGVASTTVGGVETQLSYVDTLGPTSCGGARNITRRWSGLLCGFVPFSYNQVIVIRDRTPPVVTLLVPVYDVPDVYCGGVPPFNAAQHLTVRDACRDNYTVTTTGVGTFRCGVDYVRRIHVTDACGNVATVEQVVRSPCCACGYSCEICIPPDATANCTADGLSPNLLGFASWTDSASNGAKNFMQYEDTPTKLGCGVRERRWYGSNVCGGTFSRVQRINVVDRTPPRFLAVRDVDVAPAQCETLPPFSFKSVDVYDDCQGAVTNFTTIEPAVVRCGVDMVRTVIATDACGNSASAQQTIRVPCCGCVCCGKRPTFPDYQEAVPSGNNGRYSTFGDRVLAATCWGEVVLVMADLKNQATAPLDANWRSTSVPPTAFYHHPSWSRTNIGDVFGMTFDDTGAIFLTTSAAYYNSAYATTFVTGPGGPGAVTRIAAGTALPSVFVSSWNSPIYSTANGHANHIPNTGSALGNIAFSCTHQVFYVSNFEDGLIYRISKAGAIMSRYDHGALLPTASPASPAILDSNGPGPSAYGRRVWGLAVRGGRLYYAVVNEELGSPTSTRNAVWSVALDFLGGFVGSPTRELQLPTSVWSSPITDIAFGPHGRMLVAQRSMKSATSVDAHHSAALEFVFDGLAWVPSPYVFQVGKFATGQNAAGGVAYDYGVDGRVWATGDALHLVGPNDYIYGFQGFPATSTAVRTTNSILIDANEDTTTLDKTLIGDIEVPCPTAGCVVSKVAPTCVAGTREFVCVAGTLNEYYSCWTPFESLFRACPAGTTCRNAGRYSSLTSACVSA